MKRNFCLWCIKDFQNASGFIGIPIENKANSPFLGITKWNYCPYCGKKIMRFNHEIQK